MQFKRQLKAEEDVNLTPLIDVVFLLLIFFMVSTTFTKESHLEVNLPEADGQPKTEAELKVEVVIDANGAYTVNGRVLLNSQIDTLSRALELVSNGDTSVPFVITGDANSSYQSIISVMDTAGKVGFTNISMTTRLPSEQEVAP
ncbi:MAG: biopolymer transporter ExbD [Alteromonadaceae bacterium]|nr:MAG: biopolymer transporter ExbD [Alteromonadaceae bacterium]